LFIKVIAVYFVWGWSYQHKKKFSEFWQKCLTSENSIDFTNCAPIKDSEEQFVEILAANSTKKFVMKLL
jgi:hypothetical protein